MIKGVFKVKYKVSDKVRVRGDLVSGNRYGELTFFDGNMSSHAGQICTIREVLSDKKYYVSENPFVWSEEMLEPVDSTTLRMADGTVIGEFKGIPVYAIGGTVSIHDLPTSEWYNPIKDWVDSLSGTWAKLGCTSFIMSPDEIKKMEEKKMPTKFTFYFNVNEGTRVDKSCNGTIPTITTSVVLDKFGDPDRRKCYSLKGEATCDKTDYDMRQGVLEALANAVFDGNFEKAYDKAVKTNAFCERQDRTCHYCGKVLDTIEEKQAHEAWHIERKKARRERYLLRKRAKEIAFEEQAQKIAKEMIGEQK